MNWSQGLKRLYEWELNPPLPGHRAVARGYARRVIAAAPNSYWADVAAGVAHNAGLV